MLGYFINNKPLALDSGSSLRIIWYNPACYFDEIPGDVAMGIDIPMNEINSSILGNPERFEKYTIQSSREYENFEIRFSGYILLSGTLVIQTANKESYSGWCRNNVGNLGKKHRDIFINDIPAFNQDITFTNKANYNPAADPYGCPTHFNPDFFRDKGKLVNLTRKIPNPDYVDLTFWQDLWNKQEPAYIDESYKTEALTEAFRKSSAYFVNSLYPDGSVKTISSKVNFAQLHTDLYVNVVSPMVFLHFLLEMLFRDAHFFIDKNTLADHPDLSKLILYNNFDITNVRFETEYTYELTPEIETEDYTIPAIVNAVFSIQNVIRSYDGKFRYCDLLPKMKLKDLILSIQNLLNVCFHFHRDGKVDIIDREAIIDTEPIDIDKYLVNGWNIGEKKDVTLKFLFNHDSNDIMFSEKWTDIDDRRPYEGEPVETAEDLEAIQNPVMAEIRYIKQMNCYAEYAWLQRKQTDPVSGLEVEVEMLGWQLISIGFQNGFFNRDKNEEEQIKTDFSTLIGDQTVMTQHKGNMETTKFAYENFTPRLLFYLGNNQAKSETANMALDWEKKDKGLLDTRWKKWNRFWCQRQPVSIDAALTVNMIDYITRNITSRFRAREGSFIIETMETEFFLDSIGDTKISGYKSTYAPSTTGLADHWAPGNLVFDDTLIDFTDIGLIFDNTVDLFPYGN